MVSEYDICMLIYQYVSCSLRKIINTQFSIYALYSVVDSIGMLGSDMVNPLYVTQILRND